MSAIDLFLDTDNELRFKVTVEGTRPGKSSCRLVVEGSDINYMLKGDFVSKDEVSVIIPPLGNILKEGSYNTKLEVLVDDRIFVPLSIRANFEKSVSVQAEALNRPKRKKASATATLITSSSASRNNQKINENPVSRKKEKNVITDKQIRDLIRAASKRRK
tara:strand:+ start:241 stop:723 length:483 start_codon:yes stop_codon:yes gene_type:complete